MADFKILNNKKFHYIQKNLFEQVLLSNSNDIYTNIQKFLAFETEHSSQLNVENATQIHVDRLIGTLSGIVIDSNNYGLILKFLDYVKTLVVKHEQYIDLAKKMYPIATQAEKIEINRDIGICIKFLVSRAKIKTEKKFNKVKYFLSLINSLNEIELAHTTSHKWERHLINSSLREAISINPNNLIEVLKQDELTAQLFTIVSFKEIIKFLTADVTLNRGLERIVANLHLLERLSQIEGVDKEHLKIQTSAFIDEILKINPPQLMLGIFSRFKIYDAIIGSHKTTFLNKIFLEEPRQELILKTYFANREQYQSIASVIKDDMLLAKKHIEYILRNKSLDKFITEMVADKNGVNRQTLLLMSLIKNKELNLSLEQKSRIKNKLKGIVDTKDFYPNIFRSLPGQCLDSLISIRFNNYKFSNLNETISSLLGAENLFLTLLMAEGKTKEDKAFTRETLYLKILNGHLSEIKKIILSGAPQLITLELMKKTNFLNPLISLISPLVSTYKTSKCFLPYSQHSTTYEVVSGLIDSFQGIFTPLEKLNSQNSILNYIQESQGFKSSKPEEKKEIISKFQEHKFSAFDKLIKTFFNKNSYQILINDKIHKFKAITSDDDLIDEQLFLDKIKSWVDYQKNAEKKMQILSAALIEKKLIPNDNNTCQDIHKNYSQIAEKIKDYPNFNPEKVYFLKNIFFDILDKALDIYSKIDIDSLDSHNAERVKGALSGQLISLNQELVTIYLNMTQEKEESYLKEIEIFDSYLKKKFK